MGEERRNFYHGGGFARGLIDLQMPRRAAALPAHLSAAHHLLGRWIPLPSSSGLCCNNFEGASKAVCFGGGVGARRRSIARLPWVALLVHPLARKEVHTKKQIDIYGSLYSTEIAACKHSCERSSQLFIFRDITSFCQFRKEKNSVFTVLSAEAPEAC